MKSSLSELEFSALCAGERRAQALFVELYLPRVSRWVGRGLRGREVDVGDVVQDTFVEALGSVHKVRDGERLSGWMRQVARHIVCRYYRRQHSSARLEFQDPSELEGCSVSPSFPLSTDLRAVFALMESRDAEIFVGRHVEGFKIEELSARFDVSPSTVKRSLLLGRRRVARRFQVDARSSSSFD